MDRSKAIFWWQKAADQGHADAQYNLALLHLRASSDTSFHRNTATGVELLQAASDKDHAEASCVLGSLYESGEIVGKDASRAAELFRKSASLGIEEAELRALIADEKALRERELSAIERKMQSIRGGFIQLQLERAAHQEVAQAYGGAGFFLANIKAESPVRSRVEQAHRAAGEIRNLREELRARTAELHRLRAELDARGRSLAAAEATAEALAREREVQRREAAAAELAARQQEAEAAALRQRAQAAADEGAALRSEVARLRAERTGELSAALGGVVRSAVLDQNERERALKAELDRMRAALLRGGPGGGRALASDLDFEAHAAQLLRRLQRDILVQDALLRQVWAGPRFALGPLGLSRQWSGSA